MNKLWITYGTLLGATALLALGVHIQWNSAENTERNMLSDISFERSDYNWQASLLASSQFISRDAKAAKEAEAAAQKVPEPPPKVVIDPNDISQTKVIGIYASPPGQVILKTNTAEGGFKIQLVQYQDTILEGWQLVKIEADRIYWQHSAADAKHTHYLFKPISNQEFNTDDEK